MNNRSAVQSFSWNLGILSGVFAALQVLISAATARANTSSISSMRWVLSRLDSGGGNPYPLIGSLVTVVLVTYAAMVVTGAISLGLCWYAGRITAYVQGRREGGAGAGFRVALLSGTIWIAFSIVISLLLHADGTVTGVLASTPDGSALGVQLSGLLVQELVLGAIGLGLGAWAGHIGSGSASLPDEPSMPIVQGTPQVAVYGAYPAYPTYPGYPAYPAYPPVAGYPGYPADPGYPIAAPPASHPSPAAPPAPMGNVPPSYPPPPDYYRTLGAAPATPEQPATQLSAEPAAPAQEVPSPEQPVAPPPAE
ncbi:MAG: hypothetical protein ACM3N4_00120 [Nitrososphaerota archaeon]